MVDSALALGIFGGDKAVLASDVSAGAHTLKVTTNSPSDGIVAAQYIIGTIKTGGVCTSPRRKAIAYM